MNKADGDLAAAAGHTAADYAAALHLVRPRIDGVVRPVLHVLGARAATASPRCGTRSRSSGPRSARRARRPSTAPSQARDWMWSEVTDTLLDRLRADPAVAAPDAASRPTSPPGG